MKNLPAGKPPSVPEKFPKGRTALAPAGRRRAAAPRPSTLPDSDTPPQVPAAQPAAVATATPTFPIVGIGASAGGLEAFQAFFRACPSDTGMAFVLVPHLDPDQASRLTEILQRCTAMPVVEALDRITVAPDHVYVIPSNREMAILGGVLQLSVPELARGQRRRPPLERRHLQPCRRRRIDPAAGRLAGRSRYPDPHRTRSALQASTPLARELAEGIVNTVVEPLLVLDGDLQVISASRSFYQHFQVAAGQTVGRKIYELGNGQWDIPALHELLENILPKNQVMDGYVVEHNFPGPE